MLETRVRFPAEQTFESLYWLWYSYFTGIAWQASSSEDCLQFHLNLQRGCPPSLTMTIYPPARVLLSKELNLFPKYWRGVYQPWLYRLLNSECLSFANLLLLLNRLFIFYSEVWKSGYGCWTVDRLIGHCPWLNIATSIKLMLGCLNTISRQQDKSGPIATFYRSPGIHTMEE